MFFAIIQNIADVLILVLFFSFTIFVHELGHYLTALKLGLVIDTFSIGFGPAIWQKTVNGINYKVCWIIFGGYVALPQLDPEGMEKIQGKPESENEDSKDRKKEPAVRDLPAVPAWKKVIVSVSGALGNVLFAVLLAYCIYWSPRAVTADSPGGPVSIAVSENSKAYDLGLRTGDEILAVNGREVNSWYDIRVESLLGSNQNGGTAELSVLNQGEEKKYVIEVPENQLGLVDLAGISEMSTCMLGSILEGGAAEAAGLKPGDTVLEFDGITVKDWDHFVGLVSLRGDKDVKMVYSRAGEIQSLNIMPKFNEEYDKAMIGVGPGMDIFPWMYHKNPWGQIKSDASLLFRILKALVTPTEAKQAAKGVGGPVLIFFTLWVAIKISIWNAIGFLRMLNMNLAIFNLLPIPVLDGGHIVFSAWEGITRRKVHPKVIAVLMNVFMVLFIALALTVTFRDTFVFIPKMLKLNKGNTPVAEQVEPAESGVPEESRK